MTRIWRGLALLPLLAACTAPVPRDVAVRHTASTETAGGGARWHLFLFDPREPRDLDTRIALARAQVARESDCRWAERPRAEIAARTAEQGARYADTLLAAPLVCRT
ncbi:hypothetical protein [Palleronia rufa]|uniref:hypothetical protein n=1 Tax=Palleronia rufa TaxID=1530186 RepID=UPI00068B3D68|nr:hypothetical protein [Palleronia rufa]